MIRDSKQTWQEFVSLNEIRSDGKNKCVVCGREFDEPSDWGYVSKGILQLSWKHEGCSNNGPAKAIVHDPEMAKMIQELHNILPHGKSVLFDGEKIKFLKAKKKLKRTISKKSKRKNRN